jgi:hypothetical protein
LIAIILLALPAKESRLRAIYVSLFVLLLEFNRHRLKAISDLGGKASDGDLQYE